MRATSKRWGWGSGAAYALVGALAVAGPAAAIEPRQSYPADLRAKMFAAPEFDFRDFAVPLSALPAGTAAALGPDLAALGVDPRFAFYDVRAGRLRSMVLSVPLVPGPGAGNHLTWLGLGIPTPSSDGAYEAAVLAGFQAFLQLYQAQLGIDLDELEAQPNVAVHDRRRLAHVWADRVVDGVPVRGSSVSATVNGGNLVLFNARRWGAIDVPTAPSISAAAALATVDAHAAPYTLSKPLLPTSLALVAAAGETDPLAAAFGSGYRYRLAWVVTVALAGEIGTWEALVDAHTGELLSFTDVNHYAEPERRTFGAILPLSNDGLVPDGVEQPGHPMPFATLTREDGSTVTTSAHGLAAFSGAYSTALTGPYVAMRDACGPILERTSCSHLDLGGHEGTDCDVAATADSPGNTRSSRTGFYELNRLIELWRTRAAPSEGAFAFLNGLPTPVQSNMNIEDACNAFFTPALPSINFYRYGTVVGSSGRPSTCRNTGEIAAVFDHEYGHYLDFMDGNGLSSSSEGYADAVSILRLNDSCVGRGFWVISGASTNPANPNPFGPDKCGGDGDFCMTCTGVREADWRKRRNQAPHDVDWVNGTNPNHPASGCRAGAPNPPTPPPPGLSGAPCGSGVHCEGQLVSEAIVDLYTRDLRCHGLGWENEPSATGNDVAGGRCVGDLPPTLSENTTLEIATRLFSAAKGNVQAWFECSNQFGGCNADSGFQQLLAADDDNGTLADGTPHAVAIFDAFARHQIACPLLGVLARNGGCSLATPKTVRGLTVTAGVGSATLDWADEAGAAQYWVFRTEGVRGCATGKARIATLTAGVDGSRYTDSGLLAGMPYHYSVMAVGAPGCTSQMSACRTVVPLDAGGGVAATPSLRFEQGALTVSGGDGDDFLDNCETGQLSFTVRNDGNVPLANARVTAIRPLSHPQTAVHTALPIALGDLGSECGTAAVGTATTAFELAPKGLRHGEALVFAIDVTAESPAGPVVRTGTLEVAAVETDPFVRQDVVLFDFEDGLQGWTVADGVYDRTDAAPGGAPASAPAGPPTAWYLASSRTVDYSCDLARSPAIRLLPTSTLSLFNQFAIEPTSDAVFDRANVALVDAATGERRVVSPSGGRTYTVAGGDGANPSNPFCTEGQPGWNGPGPGWLASSWTAADLGVAALPATGRDFFLEVRNGTDSTAALLGLLVDQVRLTDVLTRGPDQQPENCTVPVARDDAYTTGGMLLVVPRPGVLANDGDGDGDALTAQLVSGPSRGDLSFDADGSFVYSQDFGFTGTDSFTYRVTDGVHQSNAATVTITVR